MAVVAKERPASKIIPTSTHNLQVWYRSTQPGGNLQPDWPGQPVGSTEHEPYSIQTAEYGHLQRGAERIF
jgi:hypothetical protein